MKIITNFFKKYYIYFFCFVFPMLIFAVSLYFSDIRPFGNNSITIYDGYHQYPGISNYYANILRGTESIFYSFKGSLGFNFYAMAVYYLFNPSSLLLYFFNNININIFYEITVIAKIGLCGLSFSILLQSLKYKKTTTFLFSTAYALCAYNILYYSNYMWIDSLYLFPLVILGLNKLIYENKKTMYLILLTITIISNFYIGYMICIFLLIYFIYKYLLLNKKDRRKGLMKDFIIISLLSGLISSFALIPVIIELFMGKNELYMNGFSKYFKFDKDILTVFHKLSLNSTTTKDLAYGTPNIYSSILCLICVIFSYFNKTFTKKEKILNSIILLYFALSLSFNLMDYSWQLFQRPIWYPVRYSFIISFFLLLIASKSFNNRDKIKIKNLYIYLILILLIGLIILGDIVINNNFIYSELKIFSLLLSFILIFDYIFMIQKTNKIFNLIIILLLVLEVTFNTITTFKVFAKSSTNDYERITINNYNSKVDLIKSNDKDFYRSEFFTRHQFNNAMLFNYNGLDFFSSVRNNNGIDFLDNYVDITVKDGCSINSNFYNPVLNSLLGLKYLIGTNNAMYYDEFLKNSNIYINKDAFNLGYLVNENIYSTKLIDKDYNENIKRISNSMLGYNLDLVEKLPYELNNIEIKKDKFVPLNSGLGSITYKVDKKGFYVLNSYAYSMIKELKINGNVVKSAQTISTFIFLDENETMELTLIINKKIDQYKYELVYIPYEKYIEFVNSIKQNEMIIYDYVKDDHIKATVTSTSDKNVLFTTIPYDEGWKIFVDGKKQKYKSTLDNAFISLVLEPGNHNIEFKYTPRGLKLGIYLSITGLLLSAGYLYFTKNLTYKKN